LAKVVLPAPFGPARMRMRFEEVFDDCMRSDPWWSLDSYFILSGFFDHRFLVRTLQEVFVGEMP
jgi:hypothetical protein